ncbi:MAG: efflux RND transporter periplasmic adaptor subunit [Planctomycetes bacterium]|nr:efflux RND transporter periplasmic adaptor subunit [Planctomycetota bacterium]
MGVETAHALSGPMDITIPSIGSLRAVDSVALTTRVPGIITNLQLPEGGLVERGAILVEIDSAEERAAQREAQVGRDNAARDLERSQPLVERGIINATQLDDLRARLAGAEARLGVADARLAVRRVTAPFAGKIGLRQVSVGSFISPGTVIATLSSVNPMHLGFSIPEKHLAKLKSGLRVEARAPAFPDRVFTGTVQAIDASIDPGTQDIAVRALLPNDDGLLAPGGSMNVELVIEHIPDAITVPEQAVLLQATQAAVFQVLPVLKQGPPTAKRVPVVVGQRRAGRVQIVSGLSSGAEVVVQGLQQVRDGAPVAPKASDSDGVAAGAAPVTGSSTAASVQ